MDILKSRKNHYLENYQLEPFFKAGVHSGKVSVAEVGVIKKEIAYHGDVLNTTARIQGACNQLGQSLLASEAIIQQLSFGQEFNCRLMETPLLRGKQEQVNVYGIQKI